MNEFILQETQIHKFKDDTADFFLIFENTNERIPVHRDILITSHYFENILRPREGFLPLTSTNQLIITNKRKDILHVIIAYLYGCTIDFRKLSFEQKLLLLETAHLYSLQNLVEEVRNCVEFYIGYGNILNCIEAAVKFKLDILYDICLQFICNNIKELISFNEFVEKLTKEQLIYIFQDSGDYLYIDEVDVQECIDKWISHHEKISADEYKDIHSRCLRLELFNTEEFNNCRRLSEILTDEDHKNAIIHNNPKRRRKTRKTEIDFSKLNGVQIEGGYNTDRLLNPALDIDLQGQTQYKYTHVKHLEENPILIDLGKIKLINYMELHLYDKKEGEFPANHSYSYYIETTVDKDEGYFRVIDNSDHICRSKQRIFFYPREVRYVKIVGIATYVNLIIEDNNEYMYIESFYCQLISKNFDISRGVWTPEERITDQNLGCHLIMGLNYPKGDTAWMLEPNCSETNYSYHKLGVRNKKKALMVHMPQPVFINRISLRLLENDYEYEIMGSDRDPNFNGSFHIIQRDANNQFEGSLMQFIKIKGSSKELDAFKCSDLSCP